MTVGIWTFLTNLLPSSYSASETLEQGRVGFDCVVCALPFTMAKSYLDHLAFSPCFMQYPAQFSHDRLQRTCE